MRASANAAQAGPLAEAQSSQQVIEQRTLLAQKEAELTEQKLESEVRRRPGVRIASESYGAGVYEAVVTTLAEGRG